MSSNTQQHAQSLTSLRGITSMLLAGVFLTANDGVTKWLVPHYPVGQILCVQALIIAALVAGWIRIRGEPVFQFNNWQGHLARGLLYVVGSFAFVNALRFLPLGEVVAIAFAGPLFLTLFGKLFLGERVGPHRLLAVVFGFVGVLIMMRPSTSMHWAIFLPLIVAIADALRDIVTRRTTVGESSQRIVLSTACVLALSGAVTSVSGDWKWVELPHLIWFFISGCVFVIAHYFLIEAYRHAQTVVVAPVRYLQLLWSVLAGWLFWGEVPDQAVFVGAAFILAAGLYIAWREALQYRREG